MEIKNESEKYWEGKKYRVGIIGATGMVGQRFVSLLYNHPMFSLDLVASSPKNAGKKYREVVLNNPKNEEIKNILESCNILSDMTLQDAYDIENNAKKVDIIFSALNIEKEKIKELEEAYAKHDVVVISNNSALRGECDVPIVVPEINAKHLDIIKYQKERLATKRGFIACKPNCSIQTYLPLLKAWEEFLPYQVVVSTYQAVSGAGKILDDFSEIKNNVIPYIKGEEEKSENEPLKILGKVDDGKIKNYTDLTISAKCMRVPVEDGHSASIFIRFKKIVTKDMLIEKIDEFNNKVREITGRLPSSPDKYITYFKEEDRPQVKLDLMLDKGMTTSIGGLKEDNIFDFKFSSLSHNTLRGAAKGAVLLAEYIAKNGYLDDKN